MARTKKHFRHRCPNFAFTEDGAGGLNSKYCSVCLCFVCDKPASQCNNWFGGKGGEVCSSDADADSRMPHMNHCNVADRGADKGLWTAIKDAVGDKYSPSNTMSTCRALAVMDYNANYIICEVCGTKEDDNMLLKRCSGCNISLYCSKSCQKLAWPSHRNQCRNMSFLANSDTLYLDSCDCLELDSVLEYATAFMNNIKHVRIRINENHLLVGEEEGSDGDDEIVSITADALSTLLDSFRGRLESFWWHGNGRLFAAIDYATADLALRQGRLLARLHGLKVLRLNLVDFDTVQTVATAVNSKRT